MVEADGSDCLNFKWDKKGGVSVKNKDQYYESFFLNGLHFSLYDSVYLYEEGEREPHVGKLIRVWETKDKTKKVKVLWFFRPQEILNFLEAEVVSENELFLATGEGVGLTNINPLEAIAGKCNVICISKDDRNAQPSDEELKMADFVFYRTFHVRTYNISDQIDGKICGVEVKFIFNRMENPISGNVNRGEKKEGNLEALTSGNLSIFPTSNAFRDKRMNASFKDASCKGDLNLGSSKMKEKMDASLPNDSSRGKVNLKIHVSEVNHAHDKTFPMCKDHVGDGVNKHVISAMKSKALRDAGDKSRQLKGLNLNALDETSKEKDYNPKLMVPIMDGEANVSMENTSSMEGKFKLKRTNGSFEREKVRFSMEPSKKKVCHNEISPKTPPSGPSVKDNNSNYQDTSIRRHPKFDNRNWFKQLPWEVRIETASKQGTLVLLMNLDPLCTSMEVEDIVQHAFNEVCYAKIIQHSAISSPHSGQAFVLFKTKDAARKAVERLAEGCLLLSNGRPLLGITGNPCIPGKQSAFNGHISLSNLRCHHKPEMKEAIATSHCSQANTIEYKMALDWYLLQKRADYAWRKLYQNQGEELKKIEAGLKSKMQGTWRHLF